MAKEKNPEKKIYDFKEVEPRIQKFWEEEKIFKFKGGKGPSYSIDTPPPTVSGEMHIGHAFSYAQQDFIARFRRMNGSVLYPFGTDDNGLPTEKLVEKLKKVKSKDMSREDFIKLCLETLKEITPAFTEDWKRLGISADYNIFYSTIDDNSRKISQKNFINLYKKSEVYKKSFPTLWCPECQTAIAQAELEDKEKTTDLVYIKGKIEDSSFIIYATTRPELHPACIGISLKEDGNYVKAKKGEETWIISKDSFEKLKDEFGLNLIEEFQGKNLIGRKVEIPFAKSEVLISHDISVKTEYGTGVVYYCSYGGLDCVQWLTRHQEVKAVDIMGQDGKYNSPPIEELNSIEARKRIIELLDEKNLIIKKEEMSHVVNTHDKCGRDVEYIATPQWFIKIMDKKEKLLEQGKKIKWHPSYMLKRYENWINGLEWDWNVSRNRHFGVPIPVWECEKCNEIIVPEESELPVDPLQKEKSCPKCSSPAKPEEMVLDTWATSSLSPKIVSSLVNSKVEMPFSLRPQGHDIIRTWAFYTIAQSLLNENKIPWKDIVISGMVTRKGEKMSKSKGNVIQPKEVFEKYGADALRFWAAASKLGGDLDYQEQDLIAGKKTITKLWNASKFVFMNLEGYDGKKPKKLERIDERFLIELNRVIVTTTHRFEEYEYSRAKFNTEEFFWKFFCDYYLEVVKKRIYNETGNKKKSAQYVLYKSLLEILKLFSPIIPFVTEEIYQNYFKETEKIKSIHLTPWPEYDNKLSGWEDKNVKSHANELTLFMDLLGKVRAEKTNAKKSMNSECVITLSEIHYNDLKNVLEDFQSVTNTKEIKTGDFKVEFTE